MITVTIAGVDRSAYIDWESLTVEQQVTSQVDTAQFLVKKYGTKTYTPALGDSIQVQDGSTKIFGGTIVRVDNEVKAGGLTYLSVTASSHEYTLDRYLVVREITDQTPRYVLNTILSEFVNKKTKSIETGESTETWTQEAATIAANTTKGQYLSGSQARKFTATASNSATARRENTLDLTAYSDMTAAATGDIIKFFAYVDNIANLASIRIRCGSDTGATYTNYFEATVLAAALSTGWNEIAIAKTDFAATGTPSWADCKKRQYHVTASAAGTVNVTIDDVRLVQAATYFAQTGVQDADDITIGSVKLNYEQASEAIKQVAEAIGNDWYIDPDRVLYFYAPASIPAPFSLTDGSQNFVWDSLKISQDISTVKNQIYVRGGEYQGTSADYDQIADGTALNFRSPYRIKNISVTVAGAAKTCGVDNLDDPTAFDCLYNFMEKTLKFAAGSKPTTGQTVRMSGNPMIPVIVKRGDSVSIAQYGTFEHVIIDKSITTLQGARDRASTELRDYRDGLTEGEFDTDTSGLRAGQTISIDVTARGISDTYLIQSLTFACKSPTAFNYSAKVVSTRTFGIIEYLLAQVKAERKQIAIGENESVDLVQDMSETATVADTWTDDADLIGKTETVSPTDSVNSALNKSLTFVYAPYATPWAGAERIFVLDGSPLG